MSSAQKPVSITKKVSPVEIPIRFLEGVGPRRQEVFSQKAGINNLKDLFYYFPFRYEDRANLVPISSLKANCLAAASGAVAASSLKQISRFRPKAKIRNIFEIILKDSSGAITCIWFNQAYLSEILCLGKEVAIYGKPSLYKGRLQLVSPKFELLGDSAASDVGQIISIYRLPSQFSQRYFRKTLKKALESNYHRISDPIPFDIRKQAKILNSAKSFRQIHFPDSWQEADAARQRFIFEELFFSQIMVCLRKARRRLEKGVFFKIEKETVAKIENSLPFKLTFEQKKAVVEIISDLKKGYPMQRLLQGEVGSGKTVVAFFPLILAAVSGWQAAFMAPTEVLACQHKQSLELFLKKSGPPLNCLKNKIELITSSLTGKQREKALENLSSGKSLLAVGTHSLIQKDLIFKKLGTVVIDEQHKFGVAQRALLPKKGVLPPHCLIMSATPIPRSLALSLYGDLDFSIIDSLPLGRKKAETLLVEEKNRCRAYQVMERELNRGRQAYIVYPLIDFSDNSQMNSLNEMYQELEARFSQFNLGMFHGRLRNQDKLKVIKEFQEKKINILVATNVVEVGLDIKNATLMLVESPEKFGLSQLHQLRGRIQRSESVSFFILLYRENISEEAKKRLAVISSQNDGFKIAEADLKLRGPGDFFGCLQHGLPDLKVADPLRDIKILKQAEGFAREIIAKDPFLRSQSLKPIREHLKKHFLIKTGFHWDKQPEGEGEL